MAKEKPNALEIMTDLIRSSVKEQMQKHSITQELIDMGAFDVAKSYIDFLKKKAEKITQTP